MAVSSNYANRESALLWPSAGHYLDAALLLMRVVVAIIFFKSGWSHMQKPKARAERVGMSPAATFAIGAAEVAGVIYKKIFEWKTGFWGEKASGWHYDLMLVTMLLVILTTAGGRFVLL
ncbi:MAG: hypothetical protein H0U85_06650 [Gemmatimonadales bacterium]|nr:hypothetical protein [Gemmatimonadales bacterium]